MQDRDEIQKETPVFLDLSHLLCEALLVFCSKICVKHISRKKEFCSAKGRNLSIKGGKFCYNYKNKDKTMTKDEFKEVLMELFAEWQKQQQSDRAFDDLKFWRGVLVGVVLAVFGWLIANYSNEKPELIIVGVGLFIIASIFTIALSSAISSRINETN